MFVLRGGTQRHARHQHASSSGASSCGRGQNTSSRWYLSSRWCLSERSCPSERGQSQRVRSRWLTPETAAKMTRRVRGRTTSTCSPSALAQMRESKDLSALFPFPRERSSTVIVVVSSCQAQGCAVKGRPWFCTITSVAALLSKNRVHSCIAVHHLAGSLCSLACLLLGYRYTAAVVGADAENTKYDVN